MHCIEVEGAELRWGTRPDPEPGPGAVRLRVAATAVNRADLVQRAGAYPPPPGASDILGLEASGVVDAVGPGVTGWSVGDEACALLTGGGYATSVVAPAACLAPIPRGIDLADAAALPEVFATAWRNLVDLGGLGHGQRVLVHAGASGVGTAAVQVARLVGARSFVTAGSAGKIARCVALGADGGADRHAGPWREAVRAWAPGGVEVVLDPVGAAYLADDQRVLATDGRLVVIGLMSGMRAELDLGRLLVKRQQILGSTLRALPVEARGRVVAALVEHVWPALEAGTIRPVIEARMGLEAAAAAHARIAENGTVGKVILMAPDAPRT